MNDSKIIVLIIVLCNLITIGMEKKSHQLSNKKQNILEFFGFNSINLNNMPEFKKIIGTYILDEQQWWYLDKIFPHTKAVNAVCFNKAETALATGSRDSMAYIFNIATQKRTHFFPHNDWVNSVHFNDIGTQLVTGSNDRTARIFTLDNTENPNIIPHDGKVNSVCFDPTGQLVATGLKNFTAYIFHIKQKKTLACSHLRNPVTAVSFDPFGKFLALSTAGDAHILNIENKQKITQFNYDENANSMCFDPRGKLLAIGSPLYRASIFNIETKREVTSIDHSNSVHIVFFDFSGNYLITRSTDNIIRIFNIYTHKKVASINHDKTVLAMCVGSRTNIIATGTNRDNMARIFTMHAAWTLEQILLKKIFTLWLITEKPNKNITSSKKLLKDIAAKFQLQKEELHKVWSTFPESMQAALWRSMYDKIERYGKKVENCIIS